MTILAIDIGNTTINFGLFTRRQLAAQGSMATQPRRTTNEMTRQLKALSKLRRLHISSVEQILICSVVPRMTVMLTKSLRSLTAVPIRVVGQDLKVPLKNCYTYPKQVGQDRLVGAYAAWKEFGEGRGARGAGRGEKSRDCIVADFGTAITIDVVTKAGEYLGGVIAPGLALSLEALASRTALLPKVKLKAPLELLGRDTANSMRSGVLYGAVALCDGLVGQLKRRYAPQAVVVATGGASPLVAKYARSIDRLRPNLVLEGLSYLSAKISYNLKYKI